MLYFEFVIVFQTVTLTHVHTHNVEAAANAANSM